MFRAHLTFLTFLSTHKHHSYDTKKILKEEISITPTKIETVEDSEELNPEEASDENKSIAEIILRKHGLYKGPINYIAFKSLGHYYYLKNNQLLNK